MNSASIRTIIRLVMMVMPVMVVNGCGNHSTDSNPIPRRKAYPRIDLYEPAYTTHVINGVKFSVNAGAQITTPDTVTANHGVWFNITYPRYQAVIHCTLTPVTSSSDADRILDNRAERMALNTGGSYTEVTDIIPEQEHGFTAQMLVTPAGSVTPIQFLASDGQSHILSGSMAFRTREKADADSISPIISAITTDVVELLKSLSAE